MTGSVTGSMTGSVTGKAARPGKNASQFRQLAPGGGQRVVGIGTVIPADLSFSIRGARHQLGEHLLSQRRQGCHAGVVGHPLGLQVGGDAIGIAHPGVVVGEGLAGSNR